MGLRFEPVFIGPVGVGKTATSRVVAERLGLPRVELDEIAMEYYGSCPDFDPGTYERLIETVGFVAAYRYWEPALVFALEQAVADYPGSLLDLGAGHTCLLDASLQSRVQSALAEFANVVLLLPDSDAARSTAVIRQRLAADDRDINDWTFPEIDFVEFWIADPQNARIATHTIYTGDDPPQIAAQRVLEAIGIPPAKARQQLKPHDDRPSTS